MEILPKIVECSKMRTKYKFLNSFVGILERILNFSPAIISRTVESMNKRVDDIIALKGERINDQGDYFH